MGFWGINWSNILGNSGKLIIRCAFYFYTNVRSNFDARGSPILANSITTLLIGDLGLGPFVVAYAKTIGRTMQGDNTIGIQERYFHSMDR